MTSLIKQKKVLSVLFNPAYLLQKKGLINT